MTTTGLDGVRLLVVGASSGIGRATAVAAAARGAKVAVAARREPQLREAAEEAGGAVAVAADVSSAGSCDRLVGEASDALGGLDIIFYATGVAPLVRVEDLAEADWESVFRTNVVGASNVIRAALPVLQPGSIVSVVSSESAPAPRPGLVAYGASKAALESTLAGWRTEHPGIRFGVVTVGSTVPTDFGRDFDGELLGALFADWCRLGMLQDGFMDVDQVGEAIAGLLAAMWPNTTVGMEHVVLRPPFRVIDSLGLVQEAAGHEGS